MAQILFQWCLIPQTIDINSVNVYYRWYTLYLVDYQ